jgi:transposase-like protein
MNQFPEPPCPRCGATHVVKNGSKGGRPRWVCQNCGRSLPWARRCIACVAEVTRTLLVVMRRGSLSAAEEVTGHKYETIGRWLRMAAQHATEREFGFICAFCQSALRSLTPKHKSAEIFA